MKLRAAEIYDLSTVLSWVTSEWESRMWAGPKARYPAEPESAWSDMEASENNAYTLVDAEDAIIGFGQILPRDDNVLHLARLIVNPELRRLGIGRDLCIALMKMGESKQCAEYFTLNVYESNKAAVRLYQQIFKYYPPTTNEHHKIAVGSVFNQRKFVYACPACRYRCDRT